MKVGDIVKITFGDRFGQIVRADEYMVRWSGGIDMLTVADLFREAGQPVPEGTKIQLMDYESESVLGYVEQPNTYHIHEWFWSLSVNFSEEGWDYVESAGYTVHSADLSRLPAADAWDCLPDIVKAVVGGSA